MNISKFKKEVLVPLCISIAGCAIWAGIVWGKEQITGLKIPPLGGFAIVQFAYITVIAFVGYFFGTRSKNLELSEIYADVILDWLKQHCPTVCTFTTEHMAGNVALPVEKISLGLQRLQKHELVVKKPLFWEYSAASASNIMPGYKRLGFDKNDSIPRLNTEAASKLLAAQSQAEVLRTLPIHRQELKIDLDRLIVATSLSKDATIFVRIKLWAACDLNITKFSARMTIYDKSYEVQPLVDISDWFIIEQITDEENRPNARHTRLGPTTALLTEIEGGIFTEGHHQPKWAAFEFPLRFLENDKVVKNVKLTFYDKKGILRNESWDEWPQTTDRINHMVFFKLGE